MLVHEYIQKKKTNKQLYTMKEPIHDLMLSSKYFFFLNIDKYSNFNLLQVGKKATLV